MKEKKEVKERKVLNLIKIKIEESKSLRDLIRIDLEGIYSEFIECNFWDIFYDLTKNSLQILLCNLADSSFQLEQTSISLSKFSNFGTRLSIKIPSNKIMLVQRLKSFDFPREWDILYSKKPGNRDILELLTNTTRNYSNDESL